MNSGNKLMVELTSEQVNDFLGLIDVSLKLNGLSVLTKSVDLYNVLLSASPIKEKKQVDEEVQL